MQEFTHKRGDSFILGCTVNADITGWSIRSQIRNNKGIKLVDLTSVITQSTPTGVYTVKYMVDGSLGDTSGWNPGIYYIDIEYTDDGGRIFSTETVRINMIQDETI